MSKLIVIKESEGDRTPFLRGILVRSLVKTGLAFEDAYELAQAVRNELQEGREITSTELKGRVAVLLEERHGSQKRELYEAEPHGDSGIIVHAPTRSVPFSVGILAHSLETCAITPEMAMQGARKVLANLRKTGHREIDHKALRRVIHRCLHEHCSPEAADRYLSWRRFENSGMALIILIGGITGSGKSTVSSELAYRLDISRHQSTDMMREIIRSYLSPQMVPTLKYSSFEAWRGLPGNADGSGSATEGQVIAGFLSQFSAMKLALESTIDRAIEERQHLILEGVHVVPTELGLQARQDEAVVIPIKLACMKKELLRKQLERHGRKKNKQLAAHYLENLDDIWNLQSWLLDEADKAEITIIENWYIEDTVRAALDLVIGELMKRFPPEPDDEQYLN
ncbi:MAG: ATP cone domain-containing protein [Pseudomonadota bacterium]